MIRLIALDVDGTLLDSQWQVPEANRRAIRRATDRGIEVALVTGRRFDFARPVIDQIDAPLTFIVSGGALVKDRNGDTVVRHLLPSSVAHEVVSGTRAYREATALVFDRPAAQVVHEHLDVSDPHRGAYLERNRGQVAEVVPLEAALTEDPVQVMYSGPVERMRDVVATVRALRIAPAVSVATTEYAARDFSIVDVLRSGCTEGSHAGRLGQAPGRAPGRRDGDRRQLQRPRDARVRGRAGGDGQRGGRVEAARLAGDAR